MRTKLGVLIPSGNSTMEPELYQMAPEGVSLHFARLKLEADIEEDILQMTEYMEVEVEKLADAGVEVIAFGCTSGSLIMGKGYDQDLVNRIEAVSNITATTTSTAVLNALNAMRVRNVSLASPYPIWLHEKVVKFFEAHGFVVPATKCLDLENGIGIEKVPLDEVSRLAKSVDKPEADGIFISCTDFPSIGILHQLEEELGKPVISSNQATLWDMLRISKRKDDLSRWGNLFSTL